MFLLLIDATLVRSVLMPPSTNLAGKRHWYLPRWPRGRRPSPGRAGGGTLLAAVALVATGALASCGRSAESVAAERAQDACIAALAPVAEGRPPAPAVVREAVADAEAAAGVDRRWLPLLARLRAVRDTAGAPGAGTSIVALVEECERVNDVVRRELGQDRPAPA